MKNTKYLIHALAGLVLTLIPSYGGIIFSDNFDGAATTLNGVAPDSRPGAENWVSTGQFKADGSFSGGVGSTTGGSATLAFTPAQGLIYTIDASVTLPVTGSGSYLGFGFAAGQSTTAGSGTRFLGPTVTGRAWSFYRANTNNPNAAMDATTSSALWTNWTDTNQPSVDMRIVLDTTGGAGTWTATWYYKYPADSTYLVARATTAVLTETITSVGFSVSGDGAIGTIDSFSLSDNSVPTPPELVSINPADNATGVNPTANLVATFNKAIQLGASGDVTIKNLTTATDTVISLPGPDADGTLTVNGSQLTIDPAAALGVPGDEIVIEIGAGAIKSTEAVAYGGLLSTDDPNWSFTIDNIPPAPAYFHPISGSDQAPLDGALFIGFDDSVLKGTGNVVIHKTDDSVIETIDVTSGNVIVNGNRVTIIPIVALAYGTSYYVKIDSGAFTDTLSNSYVGISDSATWTFSTITNEAGMLFGDSFNREDGTDLDLATRGKYGSLGALAYTQRSIGAGNVGNVELTSGQLLLESNENDGNAGALAYLDHNFTDAAIATAGGFSVTLDINDNSSSTTTRYQSFALGRAAADIDAQTSVNAAGNASIADLVVALRTNGTLWIYENGTVVTGTGLTGLPATPTRMRIECTLSDFNSGSTVNYKVFFDDSVTAFHTGTFTWSGTNENYISLSSNLVQSFTIGERHSLFDNLQIRLKQAPAADNYQSWANSQLPPVTGGENGDDDKDGVKNLVEYALVNGGERGVLSGNTITFTKRGAPYGNDLTYIVETSETLSGSWVGEVTHGPAELGSPIGYDLTPVPGAPRKFARLKVVKAP